MPFLSPALLTLREENIDWNFNFAILLMASSLNSKSAYYYIFLEISQR